MIISHSPAPLTVVHDSSTILTIAMFQIDQTQEGVDSLTMRVIEPVSDNFNLDCKLRDAHIEIEPKSHGLRLGPSLVQHDHLKEKTMFTEILCSTFGFGLCCSSIIQTKLHRGFA